jgi:flagellar basal-body rod protein FlgF
MEESNYIALSGQLALEKRMATLASNIANANTVGFKAGTVSFGTLLARVGRTDSAFATTGKEGLDNSSGGLKATGNPLDLAIKGDSFFAYQSPQGSYYSRDGRLTMSPDGQLQNMNGDPILDVSGQPLQLNPAGGDALIGPDGRIAQNGNVIGQFALVHVDVSGIVPQNEVEPVADFNRNGIVQAFVEGSNVNSVSEMVNLIEVSRAFEAASTFADKAMEAERNAIEALGSR